MAKNSLRYTANWAVDVMEIVSKLKELGVKRASLAEIDELARLVAGGQKNLTRHIVNQCLKPSRFEPNRSMTDHGAKRRD